MTFLGLTIFILKMEGEELELDSGDLWSPFQFLNCILSLPT